MITQTLGAGSISSMMLARVCILAGGLATGIITARALGPEGRGQYFAVTTAAAILAQLASLGLTSSNVFLAARDRGRIRPLLVNSVLLSLAFALICGCIVALWGRQLGLAFGVPRPMLGALCIIGVATLLWNLASSLLVAAERFAALSLWQVLNALAAVAAIAVCAARRGSPQQFAFAAAAAATLTAFGVSSAIALQSPGALRFSPELIRMGVGFSARAYLALVLAYLLQRSGASVLVAAGTPAEVGQYSIASQVMDVLLIVPGSIGLVLYPFLVRQDEDLWPHVRRTAAVTTVGMLALCLVAAAVAPFILPWIFGGAYSGAATALWGLLPAVVAYTLVSILSQYVLTRNFPWSIVAAWALGLGAALASGIALTRNYGAIGAAAAQSCGATLVCALVLLITLRRAGSLRAEAPT
ncbi:MAG TPA: hypothetical protein VIE14_06180 [Steroidobacteraceae bacterium]